MEYLGAILTAFLIMGGVAWLSGVMSIEVNEEDLQDEF